MMKRKQIERFLDSLSVPKHTIKQAPTWVGAECPLAKYTHEGGTDKRPSFGITINDDGPSIYYCFTCSPEPKRLSNLVHALWIASKHYPYKAANIISGVKSEDNPWKGTSRNVRSRHIVRRGPLPDKLLKSYPLVNGDTGFEVKRIKEYLKSRGIATSTIGRFGVRYRGDRQALVFPFTDDVGAIYQMRFRSRKEKIIYTLNQKIAHEDTGRKWKTKYFARRTDVGAWFGLHLVVPKEPLILVEGEIDALRLHTLGIDNVIASGGVGVTSLQLDSLDTMQLLLGYDADDGGRKTANRIESMADPRFAVYTLDWSIVKKTNGKPCKDAGDLPDEDALNKVIRNMRRLR